MQAVIEKNPQFKRDRCRIFNTDRDISEIDFLADSEVTVYCNEKGCTHHKTTEQSELQLVE